LLGEGSEVCPTDGQCHMSHFCTVTCHTFTLPLQTISTWRYYMKQLHTVMTEPDSSRTAYFISIMVLTSIVISTITFVLDTVPSMDGPFTDRVRGGLMRFKYRTHTMVHCFGWPVRGACSTVQHPVQLQLQQTAVQHTAVQYGGVHIAHLSLWVVHVCMTSVDVEPLACNVPS
jgi:hypothetical protein